MKLAQFIDEQVIFFFFDFDFVPKPTVIEYI